MLHEAWKPAFSGWMRSRVQGSLFQVSKNRGIDIESHEDLLGTQDFEARFKVICETDLVVVLGLAVSILWVDGLGHARGLSGSTE